MKTHSVRFELSRWSLGAIACVALIGTAAPGRAIQECTGDCDNNRQVTVDELIRCVGIGLDSESVDACRACDPSLDRSVSIDELVRSVAIALGVNVQIQGRCTFVNDGQTVPCPTDAPIDFYRCDDAERCLTPTGSGIDPDSTSPIDIGCGSMRPEDCRDEQGNFRMESHDCRAVDAPMISATSVIADGASLTLRSVAFTSAPVAEVVSDLSVFTEAAVFLLFDVGLATYDPRGYAPLIAAVEDSDAARTIDFGAVAPADIAPTIAQDARDEQPVDETFIIFDIGRPRGPLSRR